MSTSKNSKIVCDHCNEQFKVERIRAEWRPPDLERTFFICPHCGKEYTISYIDDEVKVKQKRIVELQKPRMKKKERKELLALRREAIERMRALKQEQEG